MKSACSADRSVHPVVSEISEKGRAVVRTQFGRSNGCRKFESRLEDYLAGIVDSDLEAHLLSCARCQAALESGRLAGALVREAWDPALELGRAFVPGVMARIGEELERRASPAAFWRPLEFLATRLSFTAAVLLVALSVYWAGFAPVRNFAAIAQAEVTAAWVETTAPPSEPIGKEEVLLSLAENNE